MAQASIGGEQDEREIPAAPVHAGGGADRPARSGPARTAAGPRGAGRGRPEMEGPAVRLFVGAGRMAGIRPGDLVGAITGEAGIESRTLGAIQIADRFSLVEVPEDRAEDIIKALRMTTIRGKKVPVRLDRDTAR
jgi:ATP-dependent RNA helicase DeaD